MKSPFTGREMPIKIEKREILFRKEPFTVDFHFYQCDETGEEFTDVTLGDINMNQVFNQYRTKNNLPFADEIKELRARYGLSASKMSEALGFGANVYRNYENGEIPNASNARLIQLATDPEEFKKLVCLSNAFSGRELERINQRMETLIAAKQQLFHIDFEEFLVGEKVANELTGYKVPNLEKAMEVMVFFTQETNNIGEQLWKTKLNKLFFYADFGHYKSTGYSISGLQYRAIQRGPVPSKFGNLYEYAAANDYVDIAYIEFENGNLGELFTPNSKRRFNPEKFSTSELNTLQTVAQLFAKTSIKEIVALSHDEDAWIHNKDEKQLIHYSYAFTLKHLNMV